MERFRVSSFDMLLSLHYNVTDTECIFLQRGLPFCFNVVADKQILFIKCLSLKVVKVACISLAHCAYNLSFESAATGLPTEVHLLSK